MDYGKLFTKTNEQKFSLRGVQCQKICNHPGGSLTKSLLKVIYTAVEVSQKEGRRAECHLHRGDGLGNKRK